MLCSITTLEQLSRAVATSGVEVMHCRRARFFYVLAVLFPLLSSSHAACSTATVVLTSSCRKAVLYVYDRRSQSLSFQDHSDGGAVSGHDRAGYISM